MQYTYKLGFIGGGNMAKAILNGLISSKILEKNQIIIADPFIKEEINGVKVVNQNDIVLNNCEYILFAIKPQIFNEIAPTLEICKAKYAISIMAGIKSEKIAKFLPKHTQVFRIMPNTPCAIGSGMSVIAQNDAEENAKEFVKSIFDSIGKSIFLDEKHFDAVTSISGSGPAYVYYFIQSMILAGVEGGLDFETSKILTLQTVYGSSKMIENSDEDIDILIERVCSKGGTTIQAVDTFRENEMDKIIQLGIQKCKNRSEELSK